MSSDDVGTECADVVRTLQETLRETVERLSRQRYEARHERDRARRERDELRARVEALRAALQDARRWLDQMPTPRALREQREHLDFVLRYDDEAAS